MSLSFSFTMWKLVGFAGAGLFAGRWVLQYLASKRAGCPVVPPTFWMASLTGSAILLTYFAFGPQRDAVGFLGNLLPATVSAYNLSLLARGKSKAAAAAATATPAPPAARSSARPATPAAAPSAPDARLSRAA